jgi:proliferating cell nuclear antigen PCNA
MLLSISEKAKKELFVSLFHLIKSCTNAINIMFKDDHMYIQGMDKCHICLFDIKIMSHWFSKYEKKNSDQQSICIDTNIFHTVISMATENHSLVLEYDSDPDTIYIKCVNDQGKKADFDKYFNIPLCEIEEDYFSVPEIDYNVDFSMKSKKISEIITQLNIFGDVLNISCSGEEKIVFKSDGTSGYMNVEVSADDLTEFAISDEGKDLNICFGLNYLHKMCINTKLASDINVSLSNDTPMRIKYDLGKDSHCVFYLAPKSDD